ncbi:MAG: dihydrofolate reductase, partial [Clostridia bacterium]|nr:dihydrofolate reductase [Clostridia bacterium]
GGNVLKNRTNIVLSRNTEYNPVGAIMARSLEELLDIIKNYNTDNVFVIGGSQIYSMLLPYCDTAYVTKFQKSFEKDAFFPNLDNSDQWVLAETGEEQFTNPETDTESNMAFRFCIYKRV